MAGVDELGVNYVVVAALILAVISSLRGRRLGVALSAGRFIHGFGQFGSTASAGSGDGVGSKVPGPASRPVEPSAPPKPKRKNIRVSPVVLDAALKDGEALLQQLRTGASGLAQSEAESRARSTGPTRSRNAKANRHPSLNCERDRYGHRLDVRVHCPGGMMPGQLERPPDELPVAPKGSPSKRADRAAGTAPHRTNWMAAGRGIGRERWHPFDCESGARRGNRACDPR